MPIWFIAALAATFLWAVVNLIDDNLFTNFYRSARFGAAISGLFGFLPSLYLFITNESISFQPKIVFPALAAGILTIIFYYFYFKTLEVDEPSVAVALNNLTPAIVPIFAFVFLNEIVEFRQYVGLAIIVLMSTILSLVNAKKLKFSKAIVYASIGAFVYAAASVLAKFSYDQAIFRDVYLWVTFGFGIGGLGLLILGNNGKKEFKSIVKKASPILVVLVVLGEVVNIGAEFFQGFAISAGPVSLVRGIEGTQPLFVLIIGVALQPLFPKNFREMRDKRLPKKIICMSLMVVGLILIGT